MSRNTLLTAAALAGSLATLACSDKSEMSTSPDFVRRGAGFVCDFNAAKSDARDYLPASVQTVAQAALRTMSDTYTAGDTAGARTLGFDFIRDYIVVAHNDGTAIGTPAIGSKLTNDLIACMSVDVDAAVDFTGALGAKGGYQVRGGVGDDTASVLSLTKQAGLKNPAGVTYATWVGQRVLFYGAPKANTFIVDETPVKSVGFSWSTIPADHSFTSRGLVGLCVNDTDRDRVQEVNGSAGKLLPLFTSLTDIGLDCTTPLTVATRSSFLTRLGQLALSAILPEPAYAGKLGGGTGGTVNGLSDFGVVDIVSVSLTFDRIKDARINDTIPTFHVFAKSAGGSPLPSVDITLSVTGNSGSFTLKPEENPTATTDETGKATFTGLNLDKAGGYVVTASSTTAGFDGTAATATSPMFHIKR